ncbi:MAG: CHAT domain-containing tetratricopeptide repeat protein [Bacteroidales bacterium]
MQKTLIWLVCILINIIDVHGQPIPLKKSTGPGILDTSKLSKLVFEAKRKEAASYLSQYLNSQRNQNGKELTASWLDLAILLAWSDNIMESRAAYSHYAGSSAGQPDNPLLKANRLLYQSLFLSSTESSNQAADSLIASIASRPAIGSLNQAIQADSYGELARLYKKTGDLFESSRNFERSISLNRKLARTVILADDLADLSSVLSNINSADRRADSVLFESLSIYKKIDSLPAVAQVLNELGVLFNRRGDFRESLKYFMQSLQVKSKIPGLSKQEFIVVINNIGHCYKYLGNTDSALLYFSKAVDYAILSGRNPAPYYANLGAYYGGKEEYTQAIEYFQRALIGLDPTCSLTDLSTNPRINKVTPQLADFTAYKAHTYHKRYNQLHNPDDLVNGLKTFMVALEMMDTLRFMYSFESKPYLSSEAKIHFFNALDMALDLYKLTGEKKYLEQAFQLSERNKSATLNEFLRTNQAREYMGNVAPWITLEDSIKQLINKIESRIINIPAGTNSQADSIISMQTRLSDLTDELKNIGIKARRENPEYFKMVYSNHGYLPEDIQKLINPGEALVDYTVVRDNKLIPDYMIVMVLTRDTLFTYRDTLPNKFREDLRAFRASITSYVDTRVFQEFSRLANLMYQYFFAPIEKFSEINKLIILPDEELGFLPFEVFVSDTIKPKGSDFRKLSYLNRKYQISYISSHEQFYQFRSNPIKRSKSTVYAFAPFVSKGAKLDTLNLLPLENSGKEIKFISKYFRTRIFENEQAGEQTLRRAFQRESVISLSTHGIMNPGHPMQSRLILNSSEPDGSLYLFEMMSIKIRSSLVILNACNTGTGKLQVGEGIMSMARGFQFAGVPSVITTLWPIDDQSSATVMKFFFQNLHEGMDQREALMKARNTFIDQATKATGAPYFWAGQVLIGNTGSLSIHHRINLLLIVISLILVALLLTSLMVFYKKVR